MASLRHPDDGCPWDVEQTFETVKPHTVEEAYEVADAIERGDMNDLKDELGDLLFQVVFHAQMASEQNLFTLDEIIDHVTKKMIFRHPHVFGDKTAHSAKDVAENVWEQQKSKEKKVTNDHYLDGLTMNLPSLLLTSKIQKKVQKIGFKYPSIEAVFDHLSDEVSELKEAVKSEKQADIDEEFGDVLFLTALLGRHCGASNPEEALRGANLKFTKRFNAVEDYLKSKNLTLKDATVEQMSEAWTEIKKSSQKPS